MRNAELRHLQVCDIDSRRMLIHIQHGKGGRDSCRNRHCPKCLTHARNQWLVARQAELLRVGYHHVVFTLPHELSWLALQNKRVVYAKPPFGGPEHVLQYLARYTHRVAISNHRLVNVTDPGGSLATKSPRWR